jgi:hypothetical protein
MALRDPYVKGLIRGHPYGVHGEVAWTKSDGELLGAAVALVFGRPASVIGTWLDLVYDCSERSVPPYKPFAYSASRTNVSSLTVLIDLERLRVAAIYPDARARLITRTPHLPFLPTATCQPPYS